MDGANLQSIYQANLTGHTVWPGALYIGQDRQAAAVERASGGVSSLFFTLIFLTFTTARGEDMVE